MVLVVGVSDYLIRARLIEGGGGGGHVGDLKMTPAKQKEVMR